jgi:serine/threonine-protein kinase
MPPSPGADRNLLFGILALQVDFVSRDALIAAMNAWVLDKAKPLGQILLEQGALRSDTHALLEAMVHKHLEMHGNDPERSLAALSSLHSVRHDLEQVADPDVQASLVHVSAARAALDPDATRADLSSPSARRFLILRPHAKGGLGEVFVARDEELRREVALKEIQERHADHPESRARFLLEAEVTGSLEHPGIVPVYGLGTYGDGRPFYAMRFVRGDNLKDAIERFHRDKAALPAGERALRLRQLLGRFVDVCQAIAYAHSRGVLHRDLKPGNVMLGKYGETLVVDWGLAKVLGQADVEVSEGLLASSADSALTQAGRALGTPAYMSPEQAAGRLDQLGPRSDVYSLGATLYCLLTGQAPFPSGDVGEVLGKVQRGDFPRPRELDRGIHPALEAVCRKAMALRPEDRYPPPSRTATFTPALFGLLRSPMREISRGLSAVEQGDLPHRREQRGSVRIADLPAATTGGQRSQCLVPRRRRRREGPPSSHPALARWTQIFRTPAGAPSAFARSGSAQSRERRPNSCKIPRRPAELVLARGAEPWEPRIAIPSNYSGVPGKATRRPASNCWCSTGSGCGR